MAAAEAHLASACTQRFTRGGWNPVPAYAKHRHNGSADVSAPNSVCEVIQPLTSSADPQESCSNLCAYSNNTVVSMRQDV